MASDLGKGFEEQFKKDWKRCFPKTVLLRLPDQQSRYKGNSSNPCDYVAYIKPTLYMLECKERKKNTFNLKSFTQFEDMLEYKDADGAVVGVVIWFSDKDKVIFVSIQTLDQIKLDGKKSFNIKYLYTKEYDCIEIPSVKKIVYMTSDYTILRGITCHNN